MSNMIKCVIHCSDTPTGRDVSAADIHRWHLENGWDGIGYHHVIRIDGTIENGRPPYWKGSHAYGYNHTLGICLIGNGEFTEAQYTSLKGLLAKYNFDESEIVGHYEVDKHGKTCPNFDVPKWLKENYS